MAEHENFESCVIFVGNIPYSMIESELASMFDGHADIAAVAVVRDERERSRGFGFIRTTTPEQADAILAHFGSDFIHAERKIRLSKAKSDSSYLDLLVSE